MREKRGKEKEAALTSTSDSGYFNDNFSSLNTREEEIFLKIFEILNYDKDTGKSIFLDNVVTELEKIKKVEEATKNRIDESITKIGEVEEATKNLIDESIARIDKVEEDTKNSKSQWITFIGLFVSIFTFISVEIQILRYVCDFWRITGFSLVLFACLGGFVALMDCFAEKWINGKKEVNFPRKHFWVFCFTPFLLGILFASIPYISILLFNSDKLIEKTCMVSSQDIVDTKNFSDYKDKFEDNINEKLKNSENNYIKIENFKNINDISENNKDILKCLENKGYFSVECFKNQDKK